MLAMARAFQTRSLSARAAGLPFLVGALLAAGCARPEPAALRHPEFKPASIRRPAVVLRLSLEQFGGVDEGGAGRRGRGALGEAVEIALLEGLNAEGILPVDVTLSARSASRSSAERDRAQALERARTLKADVLLIAEVSLVQRDLVYCRIERRPFLARTTLWTIGAEVVRIADGTRLLIEPADAAHQLGDIEPDCDRRRIERRLSAQEMLERTIQELLALVFRK